MRTIRLPRIHIPLVRIHHERNTRRSRHRNSSSSSSTRIGAVVRTTIGTRIGAVVRTTIGTRIGAVVRTTIGTRVGAVVGTRVTSRTRVGTAIGTYVRAVVGARVASRTRVRTTIGTRVASRTRVRTTIGTCITTGPAVSAVVGARVTSRTRVSATIGARVTGRTRIGTTIGTRVTTSDQPRGVPRGRSVRVGRSALNTIPHEIHPTDLIDRRQLTLTPMRTIRLPRIHIPLVRIHHERNTRSSRHRSSTASNTPIVSTLISAAIGTRVTRRTRVRTAIGTRVTRRTRVRTAIGTRVTRRTHVRAPIGTRSGAIRSGVTGLVCDHVAVAHHVGDDIVMGHNRVHPRGAHVRQVARHLGVVDGLPYPRGRVTCGRVSPPVGRLIHARTGLQVVGCRVIRSGGDVSTLPARGWDFDLLGRLPLVGRAVEADLSLILLPPFLATFNRLLGPDLPLRTGCRDRGGQWRRGSPRRPVIRSHG
ncbi:MAG: hypothetical protein IPH03_18355 [Tetrasphaera sp.]|nr:hypothetical protein [Tetrasphaera sp.]